MAKPKDPPKQHIADIEAGLKILSSHPLFSHLAAPSVVWQNLDPPIDRDGYARLRSSRINWSKDLRYSIEVNAFQSLEPAEWAHVMAQAALHYVLCHDDPASQGPDHWIAASIVTAAFLEAIDIGRRPLALCVAEPINLGRDLDVIRRNISELNAEIRGQLAVLCLNGPSHSPFLIAHGAAPLGEIEIRQRQEILATAIRASIVSAIDDASVRAKGKATIKRNPNSLAERARSWFIAKFSVGRVVGGGL